MSDVCKGGEYDGFVLSTPRDGDLCNNGGGIIVRGGTGGCGAAAVSSFARASGRAVPTQNLYSVRSLFGGSEEMGQLQRLSEVSVPAVERLLGEDADFTEHLIEALTRLEQVSARLVAGAKDENALSEKEYEYFSTAARALVERTHDDALDKIVTDILERARDYVGLPAVEVSRRLTPDFDVREIPSRPIDFEVLLPFEELRMDGLSSRPAQLDNRLAEQIGASVGGLSAFDFLHAEEAIDAKAQLLSNLAAEPAGSTEAVPSLDGAYRRRYVDCTIYWSKSIGAYEVHGEIRRKYDVLNGPVRLGLPTTDETSTPDGRGSFNHFSKASSIYWTATTGPFSVSGAVRFRWASSGWELGSLGYPVSDQVRVSGMFPRDDVDIQWIKFENGMVAADHGDAQAALAASVSQRQLADAFYALVDRNLSSRTYELGPTTVTARPGLYGVDVLGVESGTYNFWDATPRTLHLNVRGFVSLPIVSDPTWSLELKVQFYTVWPTISFESPPVKTLVARLVWSRIRVEGVLSDLVASAISEGLHGVFNFGSVSSGERAIAEFPTGVNQQGRGNLDVLDAMLMADGTLSVFVNPVPTLAGKIRQYVGQERINGLFDKM